MQYAYILFLNDVIFKSVATGTVSKKNYRLRARIRTSLCTTENHIIAHSKVLILVGQHYNLVVHKLYQNQIIPVWCLCNEMSVKAIFKYRQTMDSKIPIDKSRIKKRKKE